MTTLTWPLFTATPIYNQCAIRLPQSGTVGEIEIPLHLTKYVSVNPSSSVVETAYGGIIDTSSNLGSGGMALSMGANQLNLLHVEGWIDTPVITITGLYPSSGLYPSPGLYPEGSGEIVYPSITIDGFGVTYAEIIASYYEGRTSTNSIGQWTQTFPRWFRDPQGRVYGDQTPIGSKGFIRIYDYTAQRIEAIPGRNNFTMTLQVA